MFRQAVNPISYRQTATGTGGTVSLIATFARGTAFITPILCISAHAQTPLALSVAAQLAAEYAPTVNTRTLLAFAWHESKLRPWAIHDNTAMRSELPASRTEAIARASTLLALNHSLDLGLCQVNSANLARTGLTVTTAFDPGQSLRAGASILVAAYQQCLHGNDHASPAEQQVALRCAASVYNTGHEQAGILNGYQAGVWHAAAQIVPAIELGATGISPPPPVVPEDVVAPEPLRAPPGLEDLLHATPPAPNAGDGLRDALHLTSRKDLR